MRAAFENKKIVLGFMTLLLIVAIIVVSSFWPFVLDPSKLNTAEFITDQLIIMAITISATVSMLFISQASNAQNPKSEIAKAKVAFEGSMKRIPEHAPFYQWVKKVLQPQDREDVAEKEFAKAGIPKEAFRLTDDEIRSLSVAQKINGTYYAPLTKKQIAAAIRIRRRANALRFVAPNYYTSHKSWEAAKNLSEIASGESAKKTLTVAFDLGLKIFMGFIGAAILASLVRDMTQDGGSTAQSWMRFLSRMFAFLTSAFSGYLLGCKTNDLDAFYVMKRVEVHTLYLEDKSFEYKDEGKEAFAERVREESVLLTMKGDGNGENEEEIAH